MVKLPELPYFPHLPPLPVVPPFPDLEQAVIWRTKGRVLDLTDAGLAKMRWQFAKVILWTILALVGAVALIVVMNFGSKSTNPWFFIIPTGCLFFGIFVATYWLEVGSYQKYRAVLVARTPGIAAEDALKKYPEYQALTPTHFFDKSLSAFMSSRTARRPRPFGHPEQADVAAYPLAWLTEVTTTNQKGNYYLHLYFQAPEQEPATGVGAGTGLAAKPPRWHVPTSVTPLQETEFFPLLLSVRPGVIVPRKYARIKGSSSSDSE